MKDGEEIGACKKRWVQMFYDWKRSNGFELKEGIFRLDITKKFFIVRVVKH